MRDGLPLYRKGTRMQTEITLQTLIICGVVIMGAWGFIKIIMEIVKAINDRHDKEQRWDETADKMLKNIQYERDKIYENYDNQLADIRKEIDDNHSDTEAKIQEVRAELYILTECMQGVLDGLHQLNCNGKVTEASEKLDAYLNERAHRG